MRVFIYIIKKYDDEKLFEISLIENLQRQDLNPVEEAFGYLRLSQEYGLTQEDIAEKVSKSRSSVANALRLLNLAENSLKALEEGKISVGHAKVLLSVADKETQDKLCKIIVENSLSVRDLEAEIKKLQKKPKKEVKLDLNVKIAYENAEKEISNIFGTKVKISNKNNKGKIQIEYYSADDLERILKILKKREKNGL